MSFSECVRVHMCVLEKRLNFFNVCWRNWCYQASFEVPRFHFYNFFMVSSTLSLHFLGKILIIMNSSKKIFIKQQLDATRTHRADLRREWISSFLTVIWGVVIPKFVLLIAQLVVSILEKEFEKWTTLTVWTLRA